MSQALNQCQEDQVHQIAQTTILAMFMRGFCVEATSANDAVKTISLTYSAVPSDRGEIVLSFVGHDDQQIAGFEV